MPCVYKSLITLMWKAVNAISHTLNMLQRGRNGTPRERDRYKIVRCLNLHGSQDFQVLQDPSRGCPGQARSVLIFYDSMIDVISYILNMLERGKNGTPRDRSVCNVVRHLYLRWMSRFSSIPRSVSRNHSAGDNCPDF